MICIYITYPDLKTAKEIVGVLLEKRLIACANFFPIESMYLWKGSIENAQEVVSLIKTANEKWKQVEDEVLRLHPYETPCILQWNAEANQSYEDWIKKEAT